VTPMRSHAESRAGRNGPWPMRQQPSRPMAGLRWGPAFFPAEPRRAMLHPQFLERWITKLPAAIQAKQQQVSLKLQQSRHRG